MPPQFSDRNEIRASRWEFFSFEPYFTIALVHVSRNDVDPPFVVFLSTSFLRLRIAANMCQSFVNSASILLEFVAMDITNFNYGTNVK